MHLLALEKYFLLKRLRVKSIIATVGTLPSLKKNASQKRRKFHQCSTPHQ